MYTFLYILTFSLLGSVGALTGAGIILLMPKLRERFRIGLLSYAIGTLLGAVFIGLLPAALDQASSHTILKITLAGFVGFFVLEKILRLPHRHAQNSADHKEVHPAATLILLGDGLHNFIDGVLITTSFFVSIPLGIVTSFAVIAHEIPQELGDFVILLESGMERKLAYWLNFISSLGTIVGAVLTYWMRETIEPHLPYVLAISASSFLYIAAVDLAPMLHRYSGIKAGIRQTIGLLAGIGTILFLHQLLG